MTVAGSHRSIRPHASGRRSRPVWTSIEIRFFLTAVLDIASFLGRAPRSDSGHPMKQVCPFRETAPK
jgi:hypothetical protein